MMVYTHKQDGDRDGEALAQVPARPLPQLPAHQDPEHVHAHPACFQADRGIHCISHVASTNVARCATDGPSRQGFLSWNTF